MRRSDRLYKAVSPEETVKHIRGILKANDIHVEESFLKTTDMVYSCRISLAGSHGEIGTNGKGMTPEYALASGYAELMERLQNRRLIPQNPATLTSAFRYYPDEQDFLWTSKSEIEENVRKFVPLSMPTEGIEADQLSGKSVPFFHLNTGKEVMVPISLTLRFTRSNGMCAGNIIEECLVQGLCEIMERHSLQQIYYAGITPPDIEKEEFEGTEILRRLEKMRTEFGMDYAIKDLTLGEGFPVIGLVIYNKDKTRCSLHLGADLSPAVALERCFTEAFQGVTVSTHNFSHDFSDHSSFDRDKEYVRSFQNSSGKIPETFFGGESSYIHNGYTTIPSGSDFREDYNNICQWIIDRGYDIYIRNNSFMGFCAAYIVIPGLSEVTLSGFNDEIFKEKLTIGRKSPLMNLRGIDAKELPLAVRLLENDDRIGVNLFPYNVNRQNYIYRNLLLAMLCIKMEDYGKAREKLESYIADCLSQKGSPAPVVYAMVQKLGGNVGKCVLDETLLARAERLIHSPARILQILNLPDCFNCQGCEIAEGCLFTLVSRVEEIFVKQLVVKEVERNNEY